MGMQNAKSMPTGGKYSDNYMKNMYMSKMASGKGEGKVMNSCTTPIKGGKY